jgi:hypothetical protein
MLQLTIPAHEYYNQRTGEFGYTHDTTIQLEHSLVSISKWESKWRKPYLGNEQKTRTQYIDYIRCMTITQNVDPMVYGFITDKQFKQIDDYINAPMTATWFSEKPGNRPPTKPIVITSEIIYYWMIALNIPVEFQKWHLNRLLTLIRVCNEKNAPARKRDKKAMLEERRALNDARRKRLNTRG